MLLAIKSTKFKPFSYKHSRALEPRVKLEQDVLSARPKRQRRVKTEDGNVKMEDAGDQEYVF